MLTAVAVHGLFDLQVQAKGDLHIDSHHTIEDVIVEVTWDPPWTTGRITERGRAALRKAGVSI